jgi:methionyl-tRNA synthetase
MDTFYITTPLYYVNARPHLGHTYTTLVADCLSRYKRMQGYDVCFLTGTDEHGQNIERAAVSQGVAPEVLADRNAGAYRKLWSRFGVEYDRFIRTTSKGHYAAATEVFQRAFDNGFVYKGEYSGWYCIPCNLFAPEAEAAPDCDVCQRPTERVTEESYFFRLSAFQKHLLDLYEKHPEFINPPSRRNEVIRFVSDGLKDLSISRTSVKWGIPVPVAENHVIYVWFDALVGYLSGIGFGNKQEQDQFRKYWPAQVQLVGKDIIRFHTVYWPAFLLAAGLPLPERVHAHGWWLKDEAKMSKSRGNVINPHLLLNHFGSDAVRYFLLREIPFGADGNFSYQAMIQRTNSDLANDWGNLVSRTLALISRNFGNTIPPPSAQTYSSLETELQEHVLATIEAYQGHMDRLAFSRALEAIWELLSRTNKYINVCAPWTMAGDEAQRPRLATILHTCAEVVRIVTILLAPVLPASCANIWKQLGQQEALNRQRLDRLQWSLELAGNRLDEITAVFPRLDRKALLETLFDSGSRGQKKPADRGKKGSPPALRDQPGKAPAPAETSSPAPTGRSTITIEDFAKVDLRVGQVVEADKVKGADRLLRLTVDLGSETRQILAGIAQAYPAESLVGKKIVVVANLQPRKLRGLESNGMLLAASVGEEDRPVLATFLEEVANGARLK